MIKRTLSVLALGGLVVSGCGAGTTVVERDDTSPAPMISTPIVSPGEVESPAVTVSSETPSITIVPQPSDTLVETPGDVPNPLEPARSPSDATATAEAPTVGSDPGMDTTPSTGGIWTPMQISVQTSADAAKLSATSPDFQAFVAARAGTPDASGCTNEMTILAFHSDGFAAGQEYAPECGGSQNIWGKQGGQWETLMVMQSVADCTDMANNAIPKGLPDIPCLDESGNVVDW